MIFMEKEKKKTKKKSKKEKIEVLTFDTDEKQKKHKQKENKKRKYKMKKEDKQQEKIKWSNKIIVLFAVIFLFLIVGYFTVFQKFLVKSEIGKLENLVQAEQIDYDKIEKKLKTTVTIGNYRKVEQAFKNYLSDVVFVSKEIHSLTSKEKLSNVLSANNLKTDGPDFKTTEKYLKNSKEELNEKFNHLIALMDKKAIMNYIDKQNLPTKYQEFYEEVAIDHNENLISMQQSLKESLDYYNTVFNTLSKAIEYLKTHKTWKIDDDKLVFNSSKDFKEYNKIIESLNNE